MLNHHVLMALHLCKDGKRFLSRPKAPRSPVQTNSLVYLKPVELVNMTKIKRMKQF